MKTIDLKTFPDYRLYIIARLQAIQMKNSAFTVSAFAKALGLKDQSSIAKIIHGKRHPGSKVTQSLIHFFKMDSKEAEYFQALIELSKNQKKPNLTKWIRERMDSKVVLAQPSLYHDHLTEERFYLISHWYALAIREMSKLKKIKLHPKKISEMLIEKVKLRDISKALDCLKKADLINVHADGTFSNHDSHFISTEDIPSEAVKQYHESVLSLAARTLRVVPLQERDYSATTLPIQKDKLALAKQRLREFREDFIREFEADPADAIYQFQFQLYPLTQNTKGTDYEN